MELKTPTLVVPIDVQALCVGNPDVTAGAAILSPEADFSVLPWNNDGQYVNASSYTSLNVIAGSSNFQGATTAAFGIHLHWALPDGLTQALVHKDQANNTPAFPQVPNRWLLSRIILDLSNPSAPATNVQSWVIESDRLLQAADPILPSGFPQPTIPLSPTTSGLTYNYIGQAFPLDGWAETEAPRLTALTATGYGNTAFAAYYPNCSTVFGFLDTFTGVSYNAASSTVHYQVTGWYSDPGNDPLNGKHYTHKHNPFGWKFTDHIAPQSTVCNGIITNISWNPDQAYFSTADNPLTVAIGNNSPEAFAALLANIKNNQTDFPNAELVLNLLQYNHLTKTGQLPDALQKFNETLHRNSFAPFKAGTHWRILSADHKKKHLHRETKPFKTALDQLNQLQAAADAELASLNAQSQQLFSYWYKYLVLRHDNPTQIPAGLDYNTAEQFVGATASTLISAIDNYQTAFLSPVQQAQAALSAGLPKHLRLNQSEPAEHFWQPNNPVLVMYGQDIAPAKRYGQDGADSDDQKLACRLDSELLTGLSLAANFVTGSAALSLDMTSLPSLSSQPDDAPCTLINTLLQESFLLTSLLQNTVATALAQQGGAANPAVLDFGTTVSNLQAALNTFLSGSAPENANYTGLAPAQLMIFTYAGNPWLPILMQYSVFYQPVQAIDTADGSPVSYTPDFLNTNFQWDENAIELVYQGTALQSGATYNGTVTLTPNARHDLAFSIKHYLDNNPNDAQKDVLTALHKQVRQLPQLSQGLSGFGDALLMFQQVIQMPVFDPITDSLTEQHFVTPVAQAVNNQNFVAPVSDVQFNPVRAGGIEITQIRLIDAFGQFKDYLNPTVFVSETLKPPPALNVSGVQAFLPPRITQPARLESGWLPGGDPIIGWVLPNRLDNSLFFYDSSGDTIGELLQPSGTDEVLFMAAAGSSFPPGTTLQTALQNANQQLADVINTLYNNGDSGYFSPFLAAVNQALETIFPPVTSDDQASALLIGQPLVLANISMQLTLMGQPAADQSWYGFATAVNGGTPTDGGLSQVAFPVRIGDLLQINDGLVGFWTVNGETADLTTFYSLGATGDTGPVISPQQDTVTLTVNAASPQNLLLLFDPRAPVHLTTGILPVNSLRLDPESYAAAFKKLQTTFLTAPVLSGANDGSMVIPIPDETQGHWDWISVSNGAWDISSLEQQASAQATLNYTPQQLIDGWLRLSSFDESGSNE